MRAGFLGRYYRGPDRLAERRDAFLRGEGPDTILDPLAYWSALGLDPEAFPEAREIVRRDRDAAAVWESEGGAGNACAPLPALPCPLVRCDRCRCPTAGELCVRKQQGRRLPGWWCEPCARRFWG